MIISFKAKRRVLLGIISFLALIFLLSLSLLFYNQANAGKIYRNVYSDNIDLSGKTKSQAKSLIENYSDNLVGNKIITKSADKEFSATYFDAGLSIDVNQTVNLAYLVGRNDNFLKSLFYSGKTVFVKKNINLDPKFNDETFSSYKTKAAQNLNIPPTDASISITNGEIVTSSSKNGVTIDSTDLKKQISAEFAKKDETATIEMPTIPISPQILSEDLAPVKNQVETYLAHQLQITLNNQIYSVDRKTIGAWITFSNQNSKYTATLNSTTIKKYVNQLAAKNDTPVIDTKVNASDGNIIDQGRQGIYTDQDDATNKIISALNNITTLATIQFVQNPKDPQVVKVFPNEGIVPGRFAGKYIDVDLTNQLLTLFDGTTQVAQYIVSTGKASTPTPVGTRTVQGHDPRAWSSPSSLWMPWFMALGGGYGIHELPEWPNGYKEGEAHLGTPVSHGCIRLGVGPAQFVYDWTPDGTQVFIHK